MSNIPYYLPGARTGYRLGNQTVVDGLINDGNLQAFDKYVTRDNLILCSHNDDRVDELFRSLGYL